ncbi:MAG: hypothetical protein HY013_13605 [Candidatus Solibacter usitatus]|nr:hypothetical protein [Candidatus Solibacter usitatus]
MRAVGILLILSVGAFAQRPAGVYGGGTSQTGHGFGNVVFPSGYAPRGPATPAPATRGFDRPAASITGYPANRAQGARGSVVYLPYGYSGYGYAPMYEPAPSVAYPPPQAAPQVIINQNFTPEVARPIVREYVTDPSDGIRIYESRPRETREPATEEKRAYLIAFKDHTIYAAFTYWQEGDTLHYVTTHGTHNQVSLSLVDRDLTDRLNRERNVEFRLPKPVERQ